MADYLENTKFVLLTTVRDPNRGEFIKEALRKNGIAAVVIQPNPAEDPKPGDALRIEVPEDIFEQALEVFDRILTEMRGKEGDDV